MRPTAFDFLRTYTENDTLFNALSGLTDKDLVFWLFDYGSRLARWRLCYELGKTPHTELARRTEFWVGRLNSGVVPGELFPCHTASTGGAL